MVTPRQVHMGLCGRGSWDSLDIPSPIIIRLQEAWVLYVYFFLIVVDVISPDSWLNSFNVFMTAGELIFVSDRDGGFWNLYRWVLLPLHR